MFWSAIGVVLLTLVGYSAGVVLAARQREVYPSLLDLLLVAGLWLLAFTLRADMTAHGWAVLVALCLGLVAGLLATLSRFALSKEPPPLPKSELPEHAREQSPTAVSRTLLRRFWQAWSAFGAQLGAIQGRLLMGYFYFLFVTPFALGFQLAGDPLRLRQRPSTSTWSAKEPLDTTLTTAREQG